MIYLNWDTYLPDKCFELSSSIEPRNNIRSDYNNMTSQSSYYKGTVKYAVKATFTYDQTQQFLVLWADLLQGNNPFRYDGLIHGNANSKVVRFTNQFKFEELGNNMVKVTVQLEIVKG